MDRNWEIRNVDILVIGLITFLIVLVFIENTNINYMEKKVRSNKYELECFMKDGWRVIDKDKIVGFDEGTGYWQFTNGYASNCIVIEKE